MFCSIAGRVSTVISTAARSVAAVRVSSEVSSRRAMFTYLSRADPGEITPVGESVTAARTAQRELPAVPLLFYGHAVQLCKYLRTLAIGYGAVERVWERLGPSRTSCGIDDDERVGRANGIQGNSANAA